MARSLKLALILCILFVNACIWIVQGGSIEEITPEDIGTPRHVTSPMKVFLLDGSTVVYENGGVITVDSIRGEGYRYSVGRLDAMPAAPIALDSVIGIEAFQDQVDVPGTVLLSTVGTAAAAAGSVLLTVAIFGSCPTLYTSPEQGGLLQAEAFSYSIAPLIEGPGCRWSMCGWVPRTPAVC